MATQTLNVERFHEEPTIYLKPDEDDTLSVSIFIAIGNSVFYVDTETGNIEDVSSQSKIKNEDGYIECNEATANLNGNELSIQPV